MSSTISAAVRAAEDALLLHLVRDEVVLFVGADVGADAAGRSLDLETLFEGLQDILPDDRPTPPHHDLDPLDVAQWYADEHGHHQVGMRIRRAYELAAQEPSTLQRALLELPVRMIFTTAYNQKLEQVLYEDGIAPNVIIDDLQVFQISGEVGTTVIKLFGCISRPDSLVLTRSDFEDYTNRHRGFMALLQAQLATRVVLFVGFSLSDPRLRALHSIIRETLQSHGRQAFALQIAPMQPLLARQWKKSGITFLTVPDADAMHAVIKRLRTGVKQTRQGLDLATMVQLLHASEASPILASSVSIVPTLETLRLQVRRLMREAGRHPELALETRLHDSEVEAGGVVPGLSTVQTLFRLAEVLEEMGLSLDVNEWRQLGNGLFRHHDWLRAIRAYTAVLRATHGTDPWTEGDLARAYMRLGQSDRAEGLLRQLVFVRSPDDQALDILWLVQRPSDLIELGHAVLHRAEQLRDNGKLEQALGALKEVRPWLRKAVGTPWMMARVQREQTVAERMVELQVGSYHPYLLICYGINYRLAYEISILVRQFHEAERFRSQAVRLFVQALQEEPMLLMAREHLIAIYDENLLQRPTAVANLRLNVEQVEALAATSERGRLLREELRVRYTRAWRRARSD